MTESLFTPVPSSLDFKTWMPLTKTFKITWPTSNTELNEVSVSSVYPLPAGFSISYPNGNFSSGSEGFKVTYDPHDRELGLPRVAPVGAVLELDLCRTGDISQVVVKLDFPPEAQDLSDHPECGTCLEKFDEKERLAHILPCGHSFCMSCLQNLVHDGLIVCPFDRKRARGNFRYVAKNYSLTNYLRIKKLKTQQAVQPPTIVDNPYVPCFENAEHECAIYCETCDASFCQSCCDEIHKTRIKRNHTFLPLADRPTPVPMCQLHRNKEVDYFCTDARCKQPHKCFCYYCRKKEHRGHVNEKVDVVLSRNFVAVEELIGKLDKAINEYSREIEYNKQSAETFSLHNDGMEKAKAHISVGGQQDLEQRIKSLEDWAVVRKRKIDSHTSLNERVVQELRQKKRRMQQKLLRKEDMLDLSEVMEIGKSVSQRRFPSERFHPLNSYRFTLDMSMPPVPPETSVKDLMRNHRKQ